MSEPLSITEVRALALSDFKRMSTSRDPTSALIGTIACTLMGAMEGERIQMSQRLFKLELRIAELEQAAKVD